VAAIRQHATATSDATRDELAAAVQAIDAADSADLRRKLATQFAADAMPTYRERPAESYHHLAAMVARRLHDGHDALLAGRGAVLLHGLNATETVVTAHELEMERELRAMLDLCGRMEPQIAREADLLALNNADKAVESDSLSPEEKALALLVSHSEWSDAKIAKTVGVSRTSLYRWTKFKQARETMKNGRSSAAPRGVRDQRTGKIDAIDDE
jgi:hypothetical protein